jgi:hypothetical protein
MFDSIGSVFKVHSSDLEWVTIVIERMKGTDTLLAHVEDQYKAIIKDVGENWKVRRTTRHKIYFTLRIMRNRCALVTRFDSYSDQLVVVFGPTPVADSVVSSAAGGSRRKRMISRKLKSLNKKRKYTLRLTRLRRRSGGVRRKN